MSEKQEADTRSTATKRIDALPEAERAKVRLDASVSSYAQACNEHQEIILRLLRLHGCPYAASQIEAASERWEAATIEHVRVTS